MSCTSHFLLGPQSTVYEWGCSGSVVHTCTRGSALQYRTHSTCQKKSCSADVVPVVETVEQLSDSAFKLNMLRISASLSVAFLVNCCNIYFPFSFCLKTANRGTTRRPDIFTRNNNKRKWHMQVFSASSCLREIVRINIRRLMSIVVTVRVEI